MKTKDQILLEQAYIDVHTNTIKSHLTTKEIRERYSIAMIDLNDIPLIVDALKKTGLEKHGVKVISLQSNSHFVYLILPKTLWPELYNSNKVQYAYLKIHEAIKPARPKSFSYTTFPEKTDLDAAKWNEIEDKHRDLRERLPELEGII